MTIARPLSPDDRIINTRDLRVPIGVSAIVEHVEWIGAGSLRAGRVRARTVTMPASTLIIQWAGGDWSPVRSGNTLPTDISWRSA